MHTTSEMPAKRPRLITILVIVAILAVVKDLYDLVVKAVDINHPNHDVQVWFGYRFRGLTAKLLTLPHLLIYGYAAYGLFRMHKLAWWLAVVYLLYLPIAFVLYILWYGSGEAWEVIFTVITLAIVAWLEMYLIKNRQRFDSR